jgi:hypothetical protein
MNLLEQITDLHDYVKDAFDLKEIQKCDKMAFMTNESKKPSFKVDEQNTEMPLHTPYGDKPAAITDPTNETSSADPEPVIVQITAGDEEEDDDDLEELK